jgi:hypothetical protein
VPQHRGDLGGDAARILDDLVPAVAESVPAADEHAVVPLSVTEGVLRGVRLAAVEFDHESPFQEGHVAVPRSPTGRRGIQFVGVHGAGRQAVRPFDQVQPPVLERRSHTVLHLREGVLEQAPPTMRASSVEGRAEAVRCREPALHHPDHEVGDGGSALAPPAPLQHGLLHAQPWWGRVGERRVVQPGQAPHRHLPGHRRSAVVTDGHVQPRRDRGTWIGEPQTRPRSGDGARPGTQDGRPHPGTWRHRAGEGRVDTQVERLPATGRQRVADAARAHAGSEELSTRDDPVLLGVLARHADHDALRSRSRADRTRWLWTTGDRRVDRCCRGDTDPPRDH